MISPYREYPPHPALAPYVACYWSINTAALLVNRILPDGCVDILLYNRLRVVGAMRQASVIELGTGHSGAGIRFKPGGAAVFFRLPLHELTDDMLDLQNLWGSFAAELSEQVAETVSACAKLAHLEAALLRRLDSLPPLNTTLQQAVSAIRQSHGQITVTRLRTELGLSERQLERCFHQHTGLAPRQFVRVARFQQVVRLLRQSGISLTEVAYRAGYYDQAHFIHDFSALAGVTPSQYRREQQHVGFLQSASLTF